MATVGVRVLKFSAIVENKLRKPWGGYKIFDLPCVMMM